MPEPQTSSLTPQQTEILQELQRRRSTLNVAQTAALDELIKRSAGSTPVVNSTVRDDSGRELKSEDPGGYWQGMWDELPNLKQALFGMAGAMAQPLDTLGNLSERQWDQLRQADKAVEAGDYPRAIQHAIGFGIPVLGPGMSDIVEDGRTNGLRHAMGRAMTFGLMNALPEAGNRFTGKPLVRGATVVPGTENPNAVSEAAYQYLESKGVPIPAGRRTGNKFLMTTQEAGENTFGGSRIAQRTEAQQAAALQADAARLANQAHPTPMTPQSAGEDVTRALGANSKAIQQGLETDAADLANRAHPQPVVPLQAGQDLREAAEAKVTGLAQQADAAYKPFHDAARDPRNARKVVVATDEHAKPIFEQMNMPVWIGTLQNQIRPLVREWEMLVEPAKRNASRGFTAMESILNWDKGQWMPADLAEKALGGLKDLVRSGKYESKGGAEFAKAMRDENQGVAGLAVSELQNQIDAAATKAGPDAVNGLKAGRQLTAQRYDLADNVVNKMAQEPVQGYGQMVYAGDSGIGYSGRVGQELPAEMPKVGRAFFDGLRDVIDAKGWKAAKAKWDALGDETKRMLFRDPALRGDIDAFFHQGTEFADTDIMKEVSHEPVAVFNKLTGPKDAQINFINRVNDIAPQELPKVGRAYLEGMFDRAAAEGGWSHAKSLFNEWEKLGDETKKLLFPNPMHRADLDKFFLATKTLAEPMNPSRTAMTLVTMHEGEMWLTAVPTATALAGSGHVVGAGLTMLPPTAISLAGWQVTKLLHSPAGVKLLRDGMRMPVGKTAYAAPMAAKILEIANGGDDNARQTK
jgi:hypothetical protein